MNYRVAFLGNFQPAFSTETDLAWTFEQLGWEVVRLQEDAVTANQIYESAKWADLMVWVHTHGWDRVPADDMRRILLELANCNIPTVGIHLDRYWGLPGREHMVRTHPFFQCSQVWTADGGNQDKFQAAGVNHFWMPPAICYRHCYIGQSKEEYKADVVFVGSGCGYHPEYPFRAALIEWLDKPHDTFTVRRWGGDKPGARAELNHIFASAKIVIGDSIFAGSPFYWSDRIPETRGRGGFILHPHSEGMTFTGMGNYAAQNLDDLEGCIGYYLANDQKREEMRMLGFEQTKRHDTYSHRVLTILNHLGMN